MLHGNRVRSVLNKANSLQDAQEPWVEELHKLYSIRPKIEDRISKLIADNSSSRPDISGIAFHDSELGDEYKEFKESVKHLSLGVIADHICNWCYLHEYVASFKIEPPIKVNDQYQGLPRITFIIKWYDPKYYPKPKNKQISHGETK